MSTIATLILIALILFFFEIVLPGGILAIIAVVLISIASFIAFEDYGAGAGVAVFLGSGLLALGTFLLEIKLLRGTRFGRLFSHNEIQHSNTGAVDYDKTTGQSGVTLTTMAPTGTVEIGGKSYPAQSLDGYLSKGTAITVIRTDPFQLKVKKQQTS